MRVHRGRPARRTRRRRRSLAPALALGALALAALAIAGVALAARQHTERPAVGASDRSAASAGAPSREATPGGEAGRASSAGSEPYAWTRFGVIAHGMGKVRHYTVTNTREAFEANYRIGHRVFEADFVFTRDGKLVARHDWTAARFARFQQEVPPGGIPTLAEFKAMKVRKRYTPLAAADVIELMRRYPDAWVMTDIKASSASARARGLRQLLDAAGGDASIRRRLIVQIYEEADLAPAREAGIENVVYTFYHLSTSTDRAIAFCKRNGIQVATVPLRMATRSLVGEIRDAGLQAATHTINTDSEATRLRDLGVTLLYTDVLLPAP